MDISKEQLMAAAENQGISRKQAEALWENLGRIENKGDSIPKLLYYFGAVIILAAMTWFLGLSWEWFNGGAIFLIASLYALFFLVLGAYLWKRKDLKTPAGLLITLAVFMVPLAIFGLETYLDIWPTNEPGTHYRDFYHTVKSSWIFMELGTIAAGLLALWFFRFPMITVPIYLAAWFLALDVTPMISGEETNWRQTAWVSLFFGLLILPIAFFLDRNRKADFAFWGYLFGTLCFWIGLTSLSVDKGEGLFLIYLVINLFLIVFSVLCQRRIMLIAGGFGVFVYLGHLAYEVFKDSTLFPFGLTGVGLLIMYLGLLYTKHIERIEQTIFNIIPSWMKHLFTKN